MFIDHDRELFRFILQYLRNGNLNMLQLSLALTERLKCEATYFCLAKLEKKLSSTTAVVDGSLPDSVYL